MFNHSTSVGGYPFVFGDTEVFMVRTTYCTTFICVRLPCPSHFRGTCGINFRQIYKYIIQVFGEREGRL